ncbi:MAG TPA: AGE family epimerase/isomerase [Capsulimonadaceae bacterium]|nr:AGE family epimerase/isomerase [Capsulimonadaceae bacterium]
MIVSELPAVALLLFSVSLASLAASSAEGASSSPKLTAKERRALTTIQTRVIWDLRDDVLPFWTRRTVDSEGGFNTVVDRFGNPISTDKYLVMQARMVWTLSAAQKYGVKNAHYLALAGEGLHFIVDKMWDPQHGGFYMQVARDGTPINTNKFLYSNEFVLYALAEYAMAAPNAGEKEFALHWAGRLFDLIQEKCADHKYGGYHEDFDRMWRPLSESLGVGDVQSGKTLNTHMHLMEALTPLVQVTGNTRYKEALGQLVDLLLEKVFTPGGSAMEPFDREWHPITDDQGRYSTYYGHDVELAWLLLDAMHALGRPPETIKKKVLGLIDNALANGFDNERGGIAALGPRQGRVFDSPSYNLYKEWWEQAESLTAFITAFRWTGDRKYLAAFEKEWDWVWKYQIDHEGGDWFTSTDWSTGKPSTLDKGDRGWKTSYHNGRALMRVGHELNILLDTK